MEQIEKQDLIGDLRTVNFFLVRAMNLLAKNGEIPLENELIICKSRINEIISEVVQKDDWKGRSHCCQCFIAEVIPDNDAIDNIVELLENIAQNHGHSKLYDELTFFSGG